MNSKHIQKLNHSILLIIVYLLLGCSGKTPVTSIEEYLAWLNDGKNGLVKVRYINGYELKVKFLPLDYLLYHEVLKDNEPREEKFASLKKKYQNSLTFLMTIGPDQRESKGADITFQGITNYSEFKKRIYDLNFYLENNVNIQMGNSLYKPVLSSMENVHGLKPSRDITFVFTPSLLNESDLFVPEQIDFIFNDELFATGISHFTFKRKDIEKIPQLTISNQIKK